VGGLNGYNFNKWILPPLFDHLPFIIYNAASILNWKESDEKKEI